MYSLILASALYGAAMVGALWLCVAKTRRGREHERIVQLMATRDSLEASNLELRAAADYFRERILELERAQPRRGINGRYAER